TVEYLIDKSNWRINGQDTVITNHASYTVRIVVTDSTASGYKMDYTYLDFHSDTIDDSPLGIYQTKLTESIGKKLIGTTIRFETTDCGEITKITNLNEIKKQAKTLFKDTMNELAELPIINELKESGVNLDLKKFAKNIDINLLVDDYLDDLNFLFAYHGRQFHIGESQSHFDATESNYEYDLYSYIESDPDDGTYSVSFDITNYVPKEAWNDALHELIAELLNKKMAENLDKSLPLQIDGNGIIESYCYIRYIPEGWPYKAIKHEITMLDTIGRLKQTRILLNAYTLH
ncbi:MAG: hypothetical protein K2O54_00645, partial [Prevotella sp.]|nr:hypothetical protein [Prevotella sp.]